MDLTIDRTESGTVVTLRASGRLDAESAGELERAVDEELRCGGHAIALDLAAVTFLSSAGIRVLLASHRAAKAAAGRCIVSAVSPQVRSVLALSKIDRLLMDEPTPPSSPPKRSSSPMPAAADVDDGPVRLVGLERPVGPPLAASVIGARGREERTAMPLPADAFAVGLAALADETSLASRAGELVAACGAVFHRPPQPFAVVDYLIAEGALVPSARFLSGIAWRGEPKGRTGFEPSGDEPSVRLDDLARSLLAQARADAIAFVIVGEIHGLVGVELIRPLAESTEADHPHAGSREIASRWLSFSREPVLGRHSAVIVGVATRGSPPGVLADCVRPLAVKPDDDLRGHAHAAVFPHRPIKRGGVDLAATIRDLTAAPPIAVMHLLADPQPALGSGQSELVRGCAWFAPLTAAGDTA